MDNRRFYKQLLAPLEALLGPMDRHTLVAIVGFDAGGPLNFCTIGRDSDNPFITYVSCELAVRHEQQPSEFGHYELLVSCDDEEWVRSVVSDIGHMSLEVPFGRGHTLDIGSWVESDAPIQGVLFEKVLAGPIDGEPYGLLRVIGITRPELEYAQTKGTPAVLARLKKAGVYPNTSVNRHSVL